MVYRAVVVEKPVDSFRVAVTTLQEADLPDGTVTVRVEWSDVNYKDALACTPDGRVVRSYPMVPGIDLAGLVVQSADPRFREGDPVLATGYDLGVSHPGGFAELTRLPADWLVHLPAGLTTEEAMALGTAGFTAAMSVRALELRGISPEAGPVLVTGATGGVGSTAVAMLANRGYTVAASTGKTSEHDYLRGLGASEILTREDVSGTSERPMESGRWAAAVDPVGGATTAYLLRTMQQGGAVALSGLTGGSAIATTVFPFILCGVALLGIDSAYAPAAVRTELWARMGADLKPAALLSSIVQRTDLDGVLETAPRILRGEVRGRTLVRLTNAS